MHEFVMLGIFVLLLFYLIVHSFYMVDVLFGFTLISLLIGVLFMMLQVKWYGLFMLLVYFSATSVLLFIFIVCVDLISERSVNYLLLTTDYLMLVFVLFAVMSSSFDYCLLTFDEVFSHNLYFNILSKSFSTILGLLLFELIIVSLFIVVGLLLHLILIGNISYSLI